MSILLLMIASDAYYRIPRYKINKVIEYYSKIDYSKQRVFTVRDSNAVKFDQLVDSYCNVGLVVNLTNTCLTRLSQYDLKKLSVKFKGGSDRIHYHTFWKPMQGKSHHLRVMKLNIYSYLATQDLRKTRLILWSVEELSVEKQLRMEFAQFVDKRIIEFKILDFDVLCNSGLFLLRQNECVNMHSGNNILLSDFVRFLVLYNYGGIYVDGDVIFLRDMKPFWMKNFVYRWSFLHSYNTAVMGIQEYRSEYIEKIYEMILVKARTVSDLVDGFYPTNIKYMVEEIGESHIFNYTDFDVYSSVLFDSAWLCFDSGDRFIGLGEQVISVNKSICAFNEFYDLSITKEEFNMNMFFPGAFAYHLHLGSCGSCNFSTNSYFNHIEQHFKTKVMRRRAGIV